MKIEIELSREQIEETVSGVLGASFYHWDWWKSVEYREGFDWKTYPTNLDEKFLQVGIADPEHYEDLLDEDEEEKTVEKWLSVADILRAWSVCAVAGYRMSDEDACTSDAVMQTAVLEEVTYG